MVMHALRMESATSDVMGLLKALGESRGEEVRAWMNVPRDLLILSPFTVR